jgi:hypothetical protein
MARKYNKEFIVQLLVKVEDGETTEADIKRDLKQKAQSVYDMKIEVQEATQVYPAIAPATPADVAPPPSPATNVADGGVVQNGQPPIAEGSSPNGPVGTAEAPAA